MSIPNEKLYELLQEIEQKAQSSQREIEVVKARMAGLQREARKAQITAKELSTLPKDANVWEGCGKMFVLEGPAELKERLVSQDKKLQEDVKGMGKRLQYLETTAKNSKEHIEQLLKGARGG